MAATHRRWLLADEWLLKLFKTPSLNQAALHQSLLEAEKKGRGDGRIYSSETRESLGNNSVLGITSEDTCISSSSHLP